MKFTKMQGLGNDYVYVNCFEETVNDPEKLAIAVSDRHFGIGSDGLILITPSEVADCRMDMYNLDGSRGAMCGNGIRCVAKYVYDHGMTNMTTIRIETLSGIKTIDLTVKDGKVRLANVDMGMPVLLSQGVNRELTPEVRKEIADSAIWEVLDVQDKEMSMIHISMGNPHAIVYVDDVKNLPIEKIAPSFEKHERFPNRVNTEFVKVLDRNTVEMRVWERGSGETLACGTGACATAVACILNGLTEEKVTVKLLGGDLEIEWDREKNKVFMTGPAKVVFDGVWEE